MSNEQISYQGAVSLKPDSSLYQERAGGSLPGQPGYAQLSNQAEDELMSVNIHFGSARCTADQ
jgi:hypothetical protein